MDCDKTVGFVLMAAGNAVRFGANKLTETLGGRALIDRALDVIPDGCPAVVVSQYDTVLARAGARGFLTVRNDRPDEGVSRTIRLGVAALARCDALAFLVGDQPLLRRETVESEVRFYREHPDCIVALAHDGKKGNPCIFPRIYFEELMNLQGDTGGSAVIRRHMQRLKLLPAPACELADADSPEALAALRALAASPEGAANGYV